MRIFLICLIAVFALFAAVSATYFLAFRENTGMTQKKVDSNRNVFDFDPKKYPLTGGQEIKPNFGGSKGGNQ